MLDRDVSQRAVRWLVVRTMVATLLAVCAWYLLRDYDKFRAISAARTCFEAADCNYKVPFLALGMISAVLLLIGNLAMIPGRVWVACLFPSAASAALWVTTKMTAGYDDIWLNTFVIAHVFLLIFLGLPIVQRRLFKRDTIAVS